MINIATYKRQQPWDDKTFNKLHCAKPVLVEWLTGNLLRR